MDDCAIVGIYLAAGKSTRMGRNKLNLPFNHTYVGSMALKSALESKLNHTIVVTRKDQPLDWLDSFSEKKGWRCLHSVAADLGQSASLKSGIKAAIDAGAEGVVVMLGDQPFVTSGMINQLIAESRRYPDLFYISFSHKGIPRPPVLLNSRIFPAVMELRHDQGARALIRGEGKKEGKYIDAACDIPFYDVDTEEDYRFLRDVLKGQ